MSHVFLGLTSRDGSERANAWDAFGFDLDRRATSADDSTSSNNVCKRLEGSYKTINADGADGVDNSFGKHIVPLIKSVNSDIEKVANQEIASGGYTLILRIDGAAENNAKAPGALFAVGPHPVGIFKTDDRWPVWASSLADGSSIDKPLRTFPLGYVRDGVWVSGEIGEGPDRIWIPIFGTIELQASALITVDLHNGEGLLAGAIPRDEFARAATPWIEKFGACPGTPTFEQVVATMTQSADLKLGARDLQDPKLACDALSVGIGFTVQPVAAPTSVIPTPPPPVDECAGAPTKP